MGRNVTYIVMAQVSPSYAECAGKSSSGEIDDHTSLGHLSALPLPGRVPLACVDRPRFRNTGLGVSGMSEERLSPSDLGTRLYCGGDNINSIRKV